MRPHKPQKGNAVVMKFGGSSLATDELREAAAACVIEAVRRGRKPVVVVSAMGRYPHAYATDTLLGLVGEKSAGPNVDLLLACGEMISCAVFAQLLERDGVPARALTGGQAGISTDANHGNARVLSVDVFFLETLLESGITPVVCGFQGTSEDGSITTLGRGGSDLTAVALARALGGAPLEIYTDVDGVMTADPKRVPSAVTIPELTFEEVTELAEHGATVMHDKAADLARLSKQDFSIRSLLSGAGTAVHDRTSTPEQPVSGVTSSAGYTFMHVVPEAAVLPGGWEQDALRVLADARISIDCVNVNSAGLFFIVRDEEDRRAQASLEALPVAVRVRRGCAKISAVGAGMRGTPGVMYRAVRALGRSGVPIIHSTDSNITISLLVPGELAAVAENALHAEFNLSSKTTAS
jgi:aspartate kinase